MKRKLDRSFDHMEQKHPVLEKDSFAKRVLALTMLFASQAMACVGSQTRPVEPLSISAETDVGFVSLQDRNRLPSYEVMETTLRKALGSYFDAYLKTHHRKRLEYIANSKPEIPHFKINGLETLGEIMDEKSVETALRAYLSSFPKAWVGSATLRTIDIVDEKTSMNIMPGYAVFQDLKRAGGYYDDQNHRVAFEKEIILADAKSFLLLLFAGLNHELAHAVAPDTFGKLNDKQFLESLYVLYQAVSDADRPKFKEPEDAQFSNDNPLDQNAVLCFKLNEYFASLLATATMISADSQDQWEQLLEQALIEKGATHKSAKFNIDFVKTYFRIVDPEYKPWAACKEQLKVVKEVSKKITALFYVRALPELKDNELRRFLHLILEKKSDELGDNAIGRWKFLVSPENADRFDVDGMSSNWEELLSKITDEQERKFCLAWYDELKKIVRAKLNQWKDIDDGALMDFNSPKDLEKLTQQLYEISQSRRIVLKEVLLEFSQKTVFPSTKKSTQ